MTNLSCCICDFRVASIHTKNFTKLIQYNTAYTFAYAILKQRGGKCVPLSVHMRLCVCYEAVLRCRKTAAAAVSHFRQIRANLLPKTTALNQRHYSISVSCSLLPNMIPQSEYRMPTQVTKHTDITPHIYKYIELPAWLNQLEENQIYFDFSHGFFHLRVLYGNPLIYPPFFSPSISGLLPGINETGKSIVIIRNVLFKRDTFNILKEGAGNLAEP